MEGDPSALRIDGEGYIGMYKRASIEQVLSLDVLCRY